MGTIGMQQLGLSPSPFGSSSNMGSVNSMGAFSTPPHQIVLSSSPPPSTYNARASTITGITRYDSPSPSMQFMARSQSPDSSFGHEMAIQPFVLPMTTPSSASMHKGGGAGAGAGAGYEAVITRQSSQDSLFAPVPPRRMNPPAYNDAVGTTGLSDSRDVAAQRRETHGTGHSAVRLPVDEKSQHLQVSQTIHGSQDSSIIGPDLAAIDAYVNQTSANTPRPGVGAGNSGGTGGGQGGLDTVPMLHTTAVTPGRPEAPQRRFTVKTINTTIDDGTNDSVGGDRDHRGENVGDRASVGIA
ncbi:hypothetical protein C8J55DRAFT_88161 [Lentinula edodes]|uniref:Uncharacterized protein n=1 Tax=Lentinula lateritia TaxID=40482 RepID=A0A9W9DNA6_9AGAR|nr:hypothetical protein C8J55DRAFT_88161 [Lentinula edodes]